jgi:hypothetical protein
MSVREYFENLRYALTGKRRDWQTEWNRATRDLVVPARLIVRDKHGHADAAFFERGMRSALGSARHALVTDKREGAKSVQRVYVSAGAQSYIGFLAMAYSGGLALDEIQRYVPEIVDALAYCDAEYQKLNRASEHNHVLDQPPNYQFAMMALAIFIGLRRSADEVRQLLDCTGAGGRDLLFDRVVQRRDPARTIGQTLRQRHYQYLIDAMDAAPAAQPALVRTFLDGWYKKVYLADGGFPTHGGDAYDGYWSYEAAAVVMLWNIDDSAFREHPYYPDALVSYYRTTG